MSLDRTVPSSTGAESPVSRYGWIYRRIGLPLFALLRVGASPEKLAWSLAVGIAIGINPLLGSTTVACLAAALLFRLNLAASQLGNHIVYPLQLALVLPFIHVGTLVFHTSALPLLPKDLIAEARRSPLALARQLWLWERHALVVWAALAVVLVPAIALLLTPLLKKLLVRVRMSPVSDSSL